MSVQNNNNAASAFHGGNRSKKSKNDLVRAAVGIYLKQKGFVGGEKFRKSDFVLVQNKKHFLFQKMLESDMRGGNSFAYSNVLCITNNHHIVDQQFGRFSQFVESQSDEIRVELKRFYAPMLCHLYLELLKARESKAAVDFLRKYAHLVAPIDTYEAPFATKINGCSVPSTEPDMDSAWQHLNIRYAREAFAEDDPELDYFMKLVQKLSSCPKLEAAELDAEISKFRSAKYEIHTNETVVKTLCSYLEKRGHVLILNLLYTWIHIHIVDHEVPQYNEETVFMPSKDDDEMEEIVQQRPKVLPAGDRSATATKRPAEEPVEHCTKSEHDSVKEESMSFKDITQNVQYCINTLKEAREQIQRPQTQFPRIVKVADKGRGLTSGHLDARECHLVAGFNNSTVQLWQINQHTGRGRHLYRCVNDSSCRWEVNNCHPEQEDAVEGDIKAHDEQTENETVREKYFAAKYEDNSYNAYGGVQLRGHGLGVTDVRFSSHYPLLYSTSKDSTLRCWRAEDFSCAGIYRGHRYPIWCLDESPVGMFTATGSKDLTARLWSLEREFPLITYAGHIQDVECLAFHPNGNYIATGSTDATVRLWCVTSGKLMRVFSDCKQPVSCITFSPDGRMIAAGGEESKVRIFDLAAGSQLNELKEHSSNVTGIAWSPNGRHLASVCRDGSIRVWDVKKLTPMNESGSSSSSYSSSSTSTSTNRLTALSSNCQRLVKVFFGNDDTICCIGS